MSFRPPPPDVELALDDLTDVNLAGQADGEILKRAGGLWVPGPLDGAIEIEPNTFGADILSTFPTGSYVGPPTQDATAWGTFGLPTNVNSDVITAVAFPLSRRQRFDQLRCAHDLNATGTYVFGIYQDAGMYPGALVATLATVVGHAVTHAHDVAIDITLNAGLYWMATIADVRGAGQWGQCNTSGYAALRRGFRAVDIGTGVATHRTAYESGLVPPPFPDPFPAGIGVAGNANYVAFFLRAAV